MCLGQQRCILYFRFCFVSAVFGDVLHVRRSEAFPAFLSFSAFYSILGHVGAMLLPVLGHCGDALGILLTM